VALVLSQSILTKIFVLGPEDLGVVPNEQDLEEARQQLEDQAGGPDALQRQIEESGLSEEALNEQVKGIAALDNVEQALLDQGAAEDLPPLPSPSAGQSPRPTPSPGQRVVQQWLQERLSTTDVVVNPEYGSWNARRGQVVPAGAAQQPSIPQAPPTGGAGGQGGQGGGQGGGLGGN
jgi:hypothetical protein